MTQLVGKILVDGWEEHLTYVFGRSESLVPEVIEPTRLDRPPLAVLQRAGDLGTRCRALVDLANDIRAHPYQLESVPDSTAE